MGSHLVVFKKLCIFMLWTNVVSALEELMYFSQEEIVSNVYLVMYRLSYEIKAE